MEIEKSWKEELKNEFEKEYYKKLCAFVEDSYRNELVYPLFEDIFRAFELCSFDKLKVVIIGQDPYHGPNQAHGLSFSVREGMVNPPSLKNIFKELEGDLDLQLSGSGDLSSWAKQGVLLLNATLTVFAGKAGSHQRKGWEEFTDVVIKTISKKKGHVVFLLWGAYARSKTALIDESKHLILQAPHPSPLSSYRGFFGCKHFSLTNSYLKKNSLEEIDWSV